MAEAEPEEIERRLNKAFDLLFEKVKMPRISLAHPQTQTLREIDHFLRTGKLLAAPTLDEIRRVLRDHLVDHFAFYGDYAGPRIARKHIGWYIDGWFSQPAHGETGFAPKPAAALRLRDEINRAECPTAQLALLDDFLDHAHDEVEFH